jgi:cystathionine gamma-synthase
MVATQMTESQHGKIDVRTLGPSSRAVRGGYEPALGEGISPAIQLSSTFHHSINPDPSVLPYSYGRDMSPAFVPLERTIADLEGAEYAVVFNAGMAAAIPLLFEAKPGTAIVMPYDCYFGIRVYAEANLPERGVEVRVVDQTDLRQVEEALTGASFFWTESPTNPLLAVADLEAIGAICREKGVPWATDNTFASPILQQPLKYGAIASMHSVTKYIGGHSDLVLGAVATNDPELLVRLRAYRGKNGTQPDGFSAWLARRGAQTLAIRVRQQSASALKIARQLREHEAVTNVYYPGLEDFPGNDIAARQMTGGFGGMLSFEVRGGAAEAEAVVNACRLWMPATSLGSVESLIERRARWTGEVASPQLLRLSVGIEDFQDLWDDLEQALNTIVKL